MSDASRLLHQSSHILAVWLPCFQSSVTDHAFNADAGLEGQIKKLAEKRNMEDDTIGPVITWTTEAMLGHVDTLLKIPGDAPSAFYASSCFADGTTEAMLGHVNALQKILALSFRVSFALFLC